MKIRIAAALMAIAGAAAAITAAVVPAHATGPAHVAAIYCPEGHH